MYLKLLLIIILCISGYLHAEEGFSGKGEIGFVLARGNTDTDTLNVDIALAYETIKWKHEASLGLLRASDKGDKTADRYILTWQSNYNLTQRQYLLLSLRYEDDKFSAFDYQASITPGYGIKLVNTDTQQLTTEIGMGAKSIKKRNTGEKENFIISKGLVNYNWKITTTTTLSNDLLLEAGSKNTLIENKTGLSVAINSKLSLNIAFEVRHNTKVDKDTENTDTLSTAGLSYKF